MRPRTAGAMLAALAGLTLAFPPARAASPRYVPAPLPPVAAKDAPGFRPCRRSRHATPATRSKPARPGEADNRRHAAPRVAQHERPGALHVPLPPLLERLPQQPLDDRARRRPARPGRPQARGAHLRVDPGQERAASRRRRAGQHDSRPDPHDPLPERGRQHRRPYGVGGADGAADRPGAGAAASASSGTRSRPPRQHRPRRLGARLPLHRAVVPQDRRLLEGRVERASLLPLDRVLLRLRHLRREVDPAERLRGRRDRPARVEDRRPDGSETFRFVQGDVHDFAWMASRRFLERRSRFEDPLPAGGRPAAPAARARAPGPAPLRGHVHRALLLRPWSASTPTSTSRASTRPGAAARRAGWSTRRSSRAARAVRARDARARRASPCTSAATSSGTASSATTSSRRRGSTRASTRT